MTDDSVSGWVLFIVALSCLGAGAFASYALTTDCWHAEAIKRGVAEYHPETGEWGWIVEVVEEEK